MPFQAALPTWLAVNNVNSPYQSGQGDSVTGFPYNAGGLNQGDYFDLTNEEAFNASYKTNGTLFSGRYRYVQVDSGATAANVKTGTVGYMRNGSTVSSVVVLTQGTGQTVGTYQVAATGGGGSGAILQVNVLSATSISVALISGGFGYTSVPTFTLATGGTPGTVAAQLNTTPNIVTSFDQVAAGTSIAVRPVVYLNSITPGNYGFIQELGVATVLGAATGSNQAQPAYVNVSASGLVVATDATTASPVAATLGLAIDHPQNASLFKIQLQYVPVVQD